MCFIDMLRALRETGLIVTPSQVRWALDSGKVSRPLLDGSLRFDFNEQNLIELHTYFSNPRSRECVSARRAKRNGNLSFEKN